MHPRSPLRWTKLHIAATAVAIGLVGLTPSRPSAQQVTRYRTLLAAGAEVSTVLPQIDQMLREGTLDIGGAQEDTMIVGRVHERLEQRYEGLPVFGGQVVRQLSGRSIVSVTGHVYEDIDVRPTASLTAADAANRARDADGAVVRGEPVLGILPRADGSYALVYKVRTRSLFDPHVYYVNANSGAIERDYSDVQTQGVIGEGIGVLGDKKKISVVPAAGTFRTDDRLRPAPNLTFDFRGSFTRLDSFDGRFFTSDFAITTDPNNKWTDGAIVDAHVYQGWTYDYYFNRFGRRGLNDRNVDITGLVHPLARADAARYPPDLVDILINNAFYDPDFNLVVYGDGDGRIFNYLAGALDVVSHELTHGVTNFSSRLEYIDESGALNEAFSDIMATSVEFFYQKPGAGPLMADWIMGEDVFRAFPGHIRSLINPISGFQPDHYSLLRFIGTRVDNGGVHYNSTIPSHAFYLAVAGGTNRVSGIRVTGVGLNNISRMEQIFYRAFVFYLGPNARFRDARAATLQAATDLYGVGSNERAQVAQAWTAVGVN